jgi:hypothetical protein
VVVHLHLEVVEGLLSEVMREFRAAPMSGAEIGGILIGTVEEGDPSIVRIEDYEPVECENPHGASYVLEDDGEDFEDVCEQWRPDESRPYYAVGYFRSHARPGLSLAPEDLDLLDCFFPAPSDVALLIKPYANQASKAGFFFRENGAFQDSTPLEFPFHRGELAGEEPPPPQTVEPYSRDAVADIEPEPEPVDEASPPRSKRPGVWIWIPLSFLFLLSGLLLGYLGARNADPRRVTGDAESFSLGLSVSRTDNNLNVKWDRDATAIRTAQRGVLEIEDGRSTKPVDLDPAQLHNGSFVYGNSSDTVRFRLEVYPKARVSVTETVEWRK